MSDEIRPLGPADREWVLRLWKPMSNILGSIPSTVWWRWENGNSPNEHFIGIPEQAFAHYRVLKTGYRNLYEIGVAESARRKGYGKALLDYIGYPMMLKTDEDNHVSRAFYKANGFRLVMIGKSKDGKRSMCRYVKVK